jgi:hypothetical protein
MDNHSDPLKININEYILWLQKFRILYSKYLNSSEELQEIFTETLEGFQRILSGNNTTSSEEDIIRLLKELVKKFSVAYDANSSINKSKQGPRNTNAFKQNIYKTEISELKKWLNDNFNNTKLFTNFESIVMFVAKKRQMIEFLKLSIIKLSLSTNYQNKNIYDLHFNIFGKRRIPDDNLLSLLIPSHAAHLHKEFQKKEIFFKDYEYLDNKEKILLTSYASFGPQWMHTDAVQHPRLFQIMNKLYSEFLSNRNNTTKKDKLVELYWLYIQTCPFQRGSASIGEIVFSVLLKNFFNCDFFISNGWNGNPEIIPDIYALMYDLDDFKKIFWDQFTNINKHKAINFRKKIIGQ